MPPTEDDAGAKPPCPTAKPSVASRIYYALLGVISFVGFAGFVGGARWVYDRLTDAPANEAMISAIAKLKTGTEAERTLALDTLTYLTSGNTKRLAHVYPEVIAFLDRRLRRRDTTLACGSASDRKQAAEAREATDAPDALKFLRSSRRAKVDSAPAPLHQVDLEMVDLHGADLRKLVFDHVCLDQAILEAATIDSVRFHYSSLRRAHLAAAHGSGVVFNNSRLDSAELNDAKLPGASFANAVLSFASLVNAQLDGADLSGAALEWSRWRGAELRETQHWTEVDTTRVAGALFDGALDMSVSDLAFLEHFGGCVRAIGQREWDDRLLLPKTRDTRCGLSAARKGSRTHRP